MAVKIRLKRIGRKRQPTYRIVVADTRTPRDGKVVDTIGNYTPYLKDKPLVLDLERLQSWCDKGAIPTDSVKRLIRRARLIGTPAAAAEAEKKTRAQRNEPAKVAETAPEAAVEPEVPAGAGPEE